MSDATAYTRAFTVDRLRHIATTASFCASVTPVVSAISPMSTSTSGLSPIRASNDSFGYGSAFDASAFTPPAIALKDEEAERLCALLESLSPGSCNRAGSGEKVTEEGLLGLLDLNGAVR